MEFKPKRQGLFHGFGVDKIHIEPEGFKPPADLVVVEFGAAWFFGAGGDVVGQVLEIKGSIHEAYEAFSRGTVCGLDMGKDFGA
jgi:hypothetical protein